MITLSTAAKAALESGSSGGYTITIGNDTLTDENVLQGSLTIEESICSGSLDFSRVEANTLRVSLINMAETASSLKGKRLTIKRTVGADSIPLGVYTIDDAVLQGDTLIEVSARDNMARFIDTYCDDWWNETLQFPISIKNMLIGLCNFVGVQYNLPQTWCNSWLTVSARTTFIEGCTAAEILGMIQEVCGCFFHVNRNGVLRRVSFGSTETYSYSVQKDDPQISDSQVPGFTGVWIRNGEDDAGTMWGSDENLYTITGNTLLLNESTASLRSIAESIQSEIGGKPYTPFKALVVCRPWVEAGDTITLTTYKGKTASAPLLRRTMSGFLLWDDTLTVEGENTQEKPVSRSRKMTILNRKIHELVITQEEFRSTIESIETNGVDADALRQEWRTEINQKATEISLSASRDAADKDGNVLETLRSELSITAEEIRAEVNDATAYLDEHGLHVLDGSNPDTRTDIDGNGLEVVSNLDGETLLSATDNGVEASRVISRTSFRLLTNTLALDFRKWHCNADNEDGIGFFLSEV